MQWILKAYSQDKESKNVHFMLVIQPQPEIQTKCVKFWHLWHTAMLHQLSCFDKGNNKWAGMQWILKAFSQDKEFKDMHFMLLIQPQPEIQVKMHEFLHHRNTAIHQLSNSDKENIKRAGLQCISERFS